MLKAHHALQINEDPTDTSNNVNIMFWSKNCGVLCPKVTQNDDLN